MKRTLRLSITYDNDDYAHVTVDDQDGNVVGYFFNEQDGRLFTKADDLLEIARQLANWELDPDHYGGDLAELAHRAREVTKGISA